MESNTTEEFAREDDEASRNKEVYMTTKATAQDLTSRTLYFLATASNETLGACIIGLGASTYLVLGRLGLVLIGVVGGIALHASWEGNIQNGTEDPFSAADIRTKKGLGLDVAKRVLDWRERKQGASAEIGEDELDIDFMTSAHKELDFSQFKPATGAALVGLTEAIIRDYVRWWYGPILPSDVSFPFACRQTLTGFLLAMSSHLSRKRPADTFLNFLTNGSSIVIVFLNELSSALMTSEAFNLNPFDAVQQYLEEDPASNLANVLDVDQQQRKLKAVADDILQTFLDSKAYNCEPVKVFLREILAGVVLEMTVKNCSKPEWINGWIVYLLAEGEPGLMNAIDAGVEGSSSCERKNASAQLDLNEGSAQHFALQDSSAGVSQGASDHKRRVSKAEDAMDEAMQEAKRLSELIAAEDSKKSLSSDDAASSGTTTGLGATPTSSQSDLFVTSNGVQGTPDERETSSATSAVDTVSSFTNFDQISSVQQPTALQPTALQPTLSSSRSIVPPPLTLHNASVSIFDESQPGERANMRSKPAVDYLLQIEPAYSQHPGWMIARKYADFETLHEVLRRISVVSGVSAFAEKYNTVPGWKNQTKSALRISLERYLRDALSYSRLAESEGMKRFLEKDQGLVHVSSNATKSTFGFPSPAAFETMGKGMLDVLASAPKGAAGGGKALLGGVSGVFGGQKRQVSSLQASGAGRSPSIPTVSRSRTDSATSITSWTRQNRESQESLRDFSASLVEPVKLPSSPSNPSDQRLIQQDQEETPTTQSGSGTTTMRSSSSEDMYTNGKASVPEQLALHHVGPELHLPPLPTEIPDDYKSFTDSPRISASAKEHTTLQPSISPPARSFPLPSQRATSSTIETPETMAPSPVQVNVKREAPKPLTEQETQVAIELFFAVVNELYTLSSAWTIRKTLLNAAKTFLLRPGNPNLEAIRVLLQDTMIDENISDVGLAAHLMKLRENALPTEEELKAWPPPMSDEDKEVLRIRARKLLVERGMPQALTSVMGAAASGEALGRIFDCLQIAAVARGLMFALILQGVRAITQ